MLGQIRENKDRIELNGHYKKINQKLRSQWSYKILVLSMDINYFRSKDYWIEKLIIKTF